ncbi:LIMR family protein Os06g0128200-like [Henckelia pumila]|uniref:LIMR family protein Os06g0128200-like n=1 Tax=Henckelia pumila TaxID=405737 RepID=UPI003C6E3B30
MSNADTILIGHKGWGFGVARLIYRADVSMMQAEPFFTKLIQKEESQIFGSVGIAYLPLGMMPSFIHCPKAVITRSQFIKGLLLLEEDVKSLEEMYPQGEKLRHLGL